MNATPENIFFKGEDSMKTFIAVLALVSLNAFAASVEVMTLTPRSLTRSVNVKGSFGINEKLGRVWAEVTEVNNDVDSMDDIYREQVAGLSLVGDTVVLNVEGQNVECAKVKHVGIFHYPVARATGNCKFVSTDKIVMEDDGFEIHKRRKIVVTLETK